MGAATLALFLSSAAVAAAVHTPVVHMSRSRPALRSRARQAPTMALDPATAASTLLPATQLVAGEAAAEPMTPLLAAQLTTCLGLCAAPFLARTRSPEWLRIA